MEISQDLNHRPIIFIRFNPDSYINNEGLLIKSCWRLNKLGIMTIIKNKKIEWNERIDTLNKQIQYWIDNQTEKTIEIIELFY
jgi:Holliday junction resolvasome RuvABC endonuclease subunit